MTARSSDPRLSERDDVIVVWNFFLDSSIQIFVLEKDHGIVVANRGFDESFGIVGRCRTNDLQSGRVHEPHLRILRVEWPTMQIAAAWATNHQRSGRSPAVMRRRYHIDDLIEGAADEVHELEFGHGAQSGESSSEGSAYDGRLRNRRIDHALGAESVDEAVGNFEGATVDTDVLAQTKDGWVALHFLPDSLADGFEIGDDGHELRSVPRAPGCGKVKWSPVAVTRSVQACKLEGRMKRIPFIVFLLVCIVPIGCSRLAAAESLWQYGRIVAVKKSVTTSTKAWVVNTPLDEEHTQYTISIHVQDRIIVGNYEISGTQSEPPPEWTPGTAVKLEVSGDSLFLRSATGSLRLHITQRKTTGPMQAVTAEEKKQLSELDAPPQSMVGFSKAGEDKATAPEPAPPPPTPPPAPSTGTVTVRSTPYLSEVFVDGDSMGYTPAKIALGPGKHSFRVEKPGYKAWTKEMTITVGSELTLDATLGRQ